jgi:hypothetical protein
MSDATSHYGVRKLVLINSGKYSCAELDLTAPVHLAAPNNRGKSTSSMRCSSSTSTTRNP